VSLLSDAVGIDWDVNQAVGNIVKAPTEFLRRVFEGQRIEDAWKGAFNPLLGGVYNLLPVSALLRTDAAKDILRDPTVNKLTFDLAKGAQSWSEWTNDLNKERESDKTIQSDAFQFLAKVGVISGAAALFPAQTGTAYAKWVEAPIKGTAELAGISAAATSGNYLKAIAGAQDFTNVNLLPNLPTIPGVPDPIRNPPGSAPSGPTDQVSDPWQWRGEPAPTYPQREQQAGISPALVIGAVLLVYLASRSRK
jgi:hypothetical protein